MRLKELRLKNGYSQQFAAEKAGCVISAYARYEREERTPSLEAMIGLSNLYNVSIEYILGMPEKDAASYSDEEKKLIELYRTADDRARDDTVLLLSRHSEDFDKRRRHKKDLK